MKLRDRLKLQYTWSKRNDGAHVLTVTPKRKPRQVCRLGAGDSGKRRTSR